MFVTSAVTGYWRRLRSMFRETCGTSAIEFAVIAPVLITACLGTVEISRFLIVQMKLERTAAVVADLATRNNSISQPIIDELFAYTELALGDQVAPAGLLLIVSSVSYAPGDTPRVAWQRSGAGTLSVASKIGTAGQPAQVPSPMVIREGESVLVTEVFASHEGWLLEFIADRQLYESAIVRPRLGLLDQIN